MNENASRHPKGLPVGGQFAPDIHTEPNMSLAKGGVQPADLDAAPGCDPAAVALLAEGGLSGRVEPYAGGNPDIEDEGALAYTSPSGRHLVLSNIADGEFTVTYEERHDEDHHFHITLDPGVSTPEVKAEAVRGALWDLAVIDAGWEHNLEGHEVYETRDMDITRAPDGSVYATLVVQNEDTLDFDEITHRFSDGTTTITRDGQALDGAAAEWELAAVFEDMRSEPADGDFQAHARKVFSDVLATAAADQDAPAWAREAAQASSDSPPATGHSRRGPVRSRAPG